MRQSGLEALHTAWEAVAWKKGGELVLRSGAETGRVFFVKGKVAWVTASTIKRTFLTHLVEHTALDRDQLQRVFDACRQSGGNFGETIVEWGLLDEPRLRELLREHLVGSFYEILCWPGLSSMFVPEDRAYKGTLTYEFTEVIDQLLRHDDRARLPFAGLSTAQIVERLQEQTGHFPIDRELAQELFPRRSRLKLTVAGFAVGLLLAAGLIFAFWYGGQHRDQEIKKRFAAQQPAAVPHAPPPRRRVVDAAPAAATDAMAVGDGQAVGTDGTALQGGDGAAAGGAAADGAAADGATAESAGDAGADAGDQNTPQAIVVGLAGEGLGSVRLLSRPGRARIYLDGLDTGRRTPYRMRRVVAGVEHVVLLERRGYQPAVRRFNLAPEMEATLRLELERASRRARRVRPEPIAVQLTSQPPGARVYVNRRYRRVKTPTEVRLDPRRASRVELRLRGHRPWRRRIRPVQGVPLVYRAELRPTKRRRRGRRR